MLRTRIAPLAQRSAVPLGPPRPLSVRQSAATSVQQLGPPRPLSIRPPATTPAMRPAPPRPLSTRPPATTPAMQLVPPRPLSTRLSAATMPPQAIASQHRTLSYPLLRQFPQTNNLSISLAAPRPITAAAQHRSNTARLFHSTRPELRRNDEKLKKQRQPQKTTPSEDNPIPKENTLWTATKFTLGIIWSVLFFFIQGIMTLFAFLFME